MDLSINNENGAAVARLRGEIDHHTAKALRTQLDKYIITFRPPELAMDMSGITFMDSSGIGLILGRSKLLKECGGSLEIRGAQPYIRRVLKLSGIGRIVKIS
ncbi:MAG: STAS domain-containing protein [Ruminococcus sp.]|nr:STAS domain-containing protein [Ruminococcus sp.]